MALAASLVATCAGAAAQRTFVSTNGVANPACSLAAPCRAFSEALGATLAGGEIIVLDSGGYGGGTITQAVSIVAPPGVYAGISVFSGDGLTISAGTSDIVKLRGLTINGLGGFNGIVVNSVGLLEVDDVRVSGFSVRGLYFAVPDGRLTVTNSVFENNGDSGLYAQPASGKAAITIDQSRFDHNAANGVVIATNATASILRSTASHNANAGFLIDAGGVASLAECKVSDTYDAVVDYGILVRGAGSRAVIANCDVFGVFYGVMVQTTARAQVVDSTAHTGGVGFEVQDAGSMLFTERTTASHNQTGYVAINSGLLVLSNDTASTNVQGVFVGGGGAVVETRQNNTIRGNGTNVNGATTTFTPL
jgi:hypothetical protein